MTLINPTSEAVDVTLNGTTYRLTSGQSRRVGVTPDPGGNDVIYIRPVLRPGCGASDSVNYFDLGIEYTLTLIERPNACPIDGQLFSAIEFSVDPPPG